MIGRVRPCLHRAPPRRPVPSGRAGQRIGSISPATSGRSWPATATSATGRGGSRAGDSTARPICRLAAIWRSRGGQKAFDSTGGGRCSRSVHFAARIIANRVAAGLPQDSGCGRLRLSVVYDHGTNPPGECSGRMMRSGSGGRDPGQKCPHRSVPRPQGRAGHLPDRPRSQPVRIAQSKVRDQAAGRPAYRTFAAAEDKSSMWSQSTPNHWHSLLTIWVARMSMSRNRSATTSPKAGGAWRRPAVQTLCNTERNRQQPIMSQ